MLTTCSSSLTLFYIELFQLFEFAYQLSVNQLPLLYSGGGLAGDRGITSLILNYFPPEFIICLLLALELAGCLGNIHFTLGG